jgi:class 3 adenylate cyclase/tetratricopeptide (TPR) repeat protein
MPTCSACGEANPEHARFCLACGTPLAAAELPREARKTVTIVFTDVVSSTALGERVDPESMRRVMARYFDAMRIAVERHGGTVEKFIGDAVMAVFGIPTVHEDDGLRAVRAATEMREALESLNAELERDFGIRIENRTGVNTGEVVVGEGQTLLTGDAVNVAARLEQTAEPGEILVGQTTYQLVEGAIEAEQIGPVELKGKRDPVPAYRLRRVLVGAEPYARRLDAPMVGRRNELTQLRTAYERTVEERAAYLFTVLGSAGMGKSRLVQEFVKGLGEEATVLSGRCLPYGEGITYWPLVEMVSGHAIEAELLAAVERETKESSEIAWQIRKLLERVAAERALVVVLDDLQWGEPTLFDLVEHVADLSREAPILLLCVARPELLEARPAWGGGKMNATSILLEPLSAAETDELIEGLLAESSLAAETRERIAAAAEGNPLFVEQMLAMADEDEGELSVPPTIHALLSSRLDRLQTRERAVIDRAAVVGHEFWRAAVTEMTPEELRRSVPGHLAMLVRKELIRPSLSAALDDDAYRFRHLLIRDAAYDGIPKELRAELHERFADWLQELAEGRHGELEEILAYHLEQAYRYRTELGRRDEHTEALAHAAGRRLATAGSRALARGDMHAAAGLLERAVALLPAAAGESVEAQVALGEALQAGGELDRAIALFAQAIPRAVELGDARLARRAELGRIWNEGHLGESLVETQRRITELLPAYERDQDDTGLALAHFRLGTVTMWSGDPRGAIEVLERGLDHAHRAGDARTAADLSGGILINSFWGPTPVSDGLRRSHDALPDLPPSRGRGIMLVSSGSLLLLASRDDEARERMTEGFALLEDLGEAVDRASTTMGPAYAWLVRREPNLVVEILRPAVATLEKLEEEAFRSTVAGLLAHALVLDGEDDEAAWFAEQSERLGAPDDYATQTAWRQARALLVANRGDHDEAALLIGQAWKVLEGMEQRLNEVLLALDEADTHEAAGRVDQARDALETVIRLAEQKEIPATVRFARQRLAVLG